MKKINKCKFHWKNVISSNLIFEALRTNRLPILLMTFLLSLPALWITKRIIILKQQLWGFSNAELQSLQSSQIPPDSFGIIKCCFSTRHAWNVNKVNLINIISCINKRSFCGGTASWNSWRQSLNWISFIFFVIIFNKNNDGDWKISLLGCWSSWKCS